MRAPEFWIEGGLPSLLLAPLGWAWGLGAMLRGRFERPRRVPIPVICVGNLVAGGAGKTPVALSIAEHLPGSHFLSRGYGGSLKGPLKVDPDRHEHGEVGDEPLLLAETAPCWVAADRIAGAEAAAAAGAACLIMDDGFQDPSIVKDFSLLVIDGHTGFGSGRCIPAGPLREPLSHGLARADAAVILGEDRHHVERLLSPLPVLKGRLEPAAETVALAGMHVVAFAGIGQPQKFFRTLRNLGAEVIEAYAFPDHYPYRAAEIGDLIAVAERHSAALVTTTKDHVRIPHHLREQVGMFQIDVAWEDEDALAGLLRRFAKSAGS